MKNNNIIGIDIAKGKDKTFYLSFCKKCMTMTNHVKINYHYECCKYEKENI